jgi:hypothetical protein
MAAVVDSRRRFVLLTGAIDQNEQNILMSIELPDGGLWTFIKAEVNLSDDAWYAWKITLGRGFRIPRNPGDRYAVARQFAQAHYLDDQNSILFTDGEVRPGESVLKVFNVELDAPGGAMNLGSMAHSRLIDIGDPATIERILGEGRPTQEVVVPVKIV